MEDYLSAEDHVLPAHLLTRNRQFVILLPTEKDQEILLTLEGWGEGVVEFCRIFAMAVITKLNAGHAQLNKKLRIDDFFTTSAFLERRVLTERLKIFRNLIEEI